MSSLLILADIARGPHVEVIPMLSSLFVQMEDRGSLLAVSLAVQARRKAARYKGEEVSFCPINVQVNSALEADGYGS